MNKGFDIVVTRNPDDVTKDGLKKIIELGATMIRINGSFLQTDEIDSVLSEIRDVCKNKVKTILDLPGFKPRFTHLKQSIDYLPGRPMHIPLSSINYPDIVKHMACGDVLRINDGMVRLSIQSIKDDVVTFIPDGSGKLRRGKGFYLEKRGYRPIDHCLSDLDIQLVEHAKKVGIDYVGVSFVHNINDLEMLKSMLQGSSTQFIPKIEARASLEDENLLPILEMCDKVIIDRGDLSGEMGLETVWYYQRKVLDLAKIFGCKVIMATQFLTSMLVKPLPSIAELDSLYDLLSFGIDGVQLSEETCVGNHGVEVVDLITKSRIAQQQVQKRHHQGEVIWIMGPTSSGKTTLAKELSDRLSRSKIPVWHYDGDEVRELFGQQLCFGPESRLTVVKTLVHLANKAAKKGHNVVISALTANEDARQFVWDSIPNLTMIYLDCPIEVCADRDPKGLYKKAQNNEIDTLIGINSVYKEPALKNFTLETYRYSVQESVDMLLKYLMTNQKVNLWYKKFLNN